MIFLTWGWFILCRISILSKEKCQQKITLKLCHPTEVHGGSLQETWLGLGVWVEDETCKEGPYCVEVGSCCLVVWCNAWDLMACKLQKKVYLENCHCGECILLSFGVWLDSWVHHLAVEWWVFYRQMPKSNRKWWDRLIDIKLWNGRDFCRNAKQPFSSLQ